MAVCGADALANVCCVQEESGADDEQAREKRKLEGVTQAKFGVKNAILGFVFGVSTASPKWSTSGGRESKPVLVL